MMESLLEQKRELAAYSADYELPVTLNAQQWALMESITTLLSLFEQITREISKEDASTADVIPLFETLKRLLSKEADSDHGVKTTTSANALRSATHKLHLCPVQRHGHLPDDQRVCGL